MTPVEVNPKELYEAYMKNKGFLDLLKSVRLKDALLFKPKVQCDPCPYHHVCCCLDSEPLSIPESKWRYCELFDKETGKCKDYEHRPTMCVAWVCEEKRLLKSWCVVEASPNGITDWGFITTQLTQYLKERKDVGFIVTKGSKVAGVVRVFAQMFGRDVKEIEMDYQRYKQGAGKVKNEFMSKDGDFGLFFSHPRDKVIPDLKGRFDRRKKLYREYKSSSGGVF